MSSLVMIPSEEKSSSREADPEVEEPPEEHVHAREVSAARAGLRVRRHERHDAVGIALLPADAGLGERVIGQGGDAARRHRRGHRQDGSWNPGECQA